MNAFFELIQMSLGIRDELSQLPRDVKEWENLQQTCIHHNLLAFTFPVIDRLHDVTDIPLRVYSRWAMATEKIQDKNKRINEACVRLCNGFAKYGFKACVLKGPSAAIRYPDPSLRHSGDIDIWVSGGHRRIMPFLREHFTIQHIQYHHCGAKMVKGVEVEVHFKPTWMNGFCANRHLQKFFQENADEQFGNNNPDLGFPVPTARFDAVFHIVHIFRHVLDEGVGLRQLLDYHFLLATMTDDDRQSAVAVLKTLRLDGFAAGLMYVLQAVFATPGEVLLCRPDESQGRFLLDEIMLSGNFGKYDARNSHDKNENRIEHLIRKMKRLLRFVRFYPSEVLNTPVFMLWHFLWRVLNGYYKV